MRKMIVTMFLVMTMCVMGASLAGAAVLLNDNFNSENGGVDQLNYSAFANWNVTRQAVDLIGQPDGPWNWFSGTNGMYVDMNGTNGVPGKIGSKTAFGAGTYMLEFDMAGSQRGSTNTVDVSFGDYSQSITLASADAFTHYKALVTVFGSSAVSFDQITNTQTNVGLLLDNVVVTPLPSTLLFLGTGLVGLIARKLRG